MTELKVGVKVKIDGIEATGKIVGEWTDENCSTQYNVRYPDNDGCLHVMWFSAASLQVV